MSDKDRAPPALEADPAVRPPDPVPSDSAAGGRGGLDLPLTGNFPALHPPAGQHEFEDPRSQEIALWLTAFAKGAKGIRVYAQNNAMLKRYLDDAYQLLAGILDKADEITLNVREDRLLFGKDAVHVNNNRDEGIPFTLFRNAFRRLTFVKGMTREEMVALLGAIVTDYRQFDYAGEDLSTELWRLSLPHLRYLTIDVMAVDAKRADQSDRVEIERIQEAIEDIVAHIYKTQASDDDIVAGVSITKEDLEALKEIRQEEKEDLDLLDMATARAIVDIDPRAIDQIRTVLAGETRDSLSTKLIDILVIILFKEQSSSESAQTIELIKLLYDSLLVAQRFEHAKHLIQRLREYTTTAEDLKVVHISGQLLRLFSTEARVMPVLNSFNDAQKQTSVQQVLEFLRSLGAQIVPILLSSLDFLTSPAHRRLICDLVLEYGVPDKQLLWEKMQGAKWFVVRDILGMAQRLPLDEIAGMVDAALKNEHPKVREHAVGLLRGYARGTADRLVTEKLLDPDLEVRLAAIRVAAARRSFEARATIELMLSREDIADREPRELRLLMAAYAAIVGSEAVPTLDKVLNPGFFARSKMTEAQIAAAFALASIGTQPAIQAIQRGLRTLNTRVRDACKKALARDFAETSGEAHVTGSLHIPKASTPIPGVGTGPLHIPSPGREPSSELRLAPLPPHEMSPPSLRIPGEGTPSANRSAKGASVPEDAPDFVVPDRAAPQPARIPIPQATTVPNVPRSSNPNVGRVHASAPVRDELPTSLTMMADVADAATEQASPASIDEDVLPRAALAAELRAQAVTRGPPSPPPPPAASTIHPQADIPIDFEAAEELPVKRPPPVKPPPSDVVPALPRFSIPEASTERVPLPVARDRRAPIKSGPPGRGAASTAAPSSAPNRPRGPAPPSSGSLRLPPMPPPNAPISSAVDPDESIPAPEETRASPLDDWAAAIAPPPSSPGSPSWAADLTLEPDPPDRPDPPGPRGPSRKR
jgi:hypothetical protein